MNVPILIRILAHINNLLRMSSAMICILEKTAFDWSHQSEILIDQSYGCMLRKDFSVQAL